MIFFVILALILAVLAVVFALQNTLQVAVSFLVWKFNGSLALVLIVSVLAGMLISFLAYLPTLLRSYFSARRMRKHTGELELNLADHKQRLEEALLKLQGQSAPAPPPETNPAQPDQPKPAD